MIYIMSRARARAKMRWCFTPRQPLRLYHGEERGRERERDSTFKWFTKNRLERVLISTYSTFKWFTKNRLERVLISTYTTRYTKIMYTLAWKYINSQSHKTTRLYIHTTQITRLHRLWAGGGAGSRRKIHIHK